MPQDSHNQLLSTIPRLGKDVTVQIGDPVDVAHLVARYHEAAAERAARRAKNNGVSGATPPDLPVHLLSHDDEMVAARVNYTGVAVPAYHERPLMIKPSDHASLSASEKLIEEKFRLGLYRDITDAVHAAVCELEVKVRDRRRAHGLAHLDDDMR
jgi:hypothetical protein